MCVCAFCIVAHCCVVLRGESIRLDGCFILASLFPARLSGFWKLAIVGLRFVCVAVVALSFMCVAGVCCPPCLFRLLLVVCVCYVFVRVALRSGAVCCLCCTVCLVPCHI